MQTAELLQEESMLDPIARSRCLLATQMREHGFSGGQVHALAARTLLREAGWSADIVTPFSGRARLRAPVFALRYALQPFSRQTAILHYRHGHDMYLRAALRRAVESEPEGAILYAQDPLSAQSALAVRRPGLDKAVLVVHFNDSQASEWAARGEVPENGWVYRRIEALEREVLPRVDALVYVSRYMKERIEARIPGAAAVPSAIIPNFVAPPELTPAARPGDILSIGTLEPRKNQAYTLRVLARLHARGLPLTATFLGDGPDRGAMEGLARELGLTPFVHFAGNVPNAAGWLPAHRVLAHASRLENCPVALIEALAAGVPVLAAAVGGIPEIVDNSTGAMWNLDSVEDGARKLEELLTDERRFELAGRCARARYEAGFSVESAGRALAGLFADLLGVRASSVKQ